MAVSNQITSHFPDHMSILEQATGRMTQAWNQPSPGNMSALGGFLQPSTIHDGINGASDIPKCNLDQIGQPYFGLTAGNLNGIKDTETTGSVNNLPSISTLGQSTSDSSSRSQSARSSGEDRSKYKTELCRQFSQFQYCTYGNRCVFAHGPWELRTLSHHKKYKTQYCREYYGAGAGTCPYGSRCHFLHEESPVIAYLLKQGLATRDPVACTIVLLPKALELLTMAKETVPLPLPSLVQPTVALPSFSPNFSPTNLS